MTDLVSCVIHDIEKALDQGLTASLLTLDVKGAFDTVLPGRLQARLREQGWPHEIVSWTSSFMAERTAKIRFEDITTAERPLSYGLLQGSPASPVLFILYLEPLFKLNSPKQAFGYADDVAFLRTGSTLERSTAKLATNLEAALEWGTQNGISFDPEKCELQYFTRKNGPSNLRLKLESLNISPNKATR